MRFLFAWLFYLLSRLLAWSFRLYFLRIGAVSLMIRLRNGYIYLKPPFFFLSVPNKATRFSPQRSRIVILRHLFLSWHAISARFFDSPVPGFPFRVRAALEKTGVEEERKKRGSEITPIAPRSSFKPRWTM